MQRIIGSQTHSKTHDMQRDYYLNQKKAMEINPRHPLIKELLRRVEDNPDDSVAKVILVFLLFWFWTSSYLNHVYVSIWFELFSVFTCSSVLSAWVFEGFLKFYWPFGQKKGHKKVHWSDKTELQVKRAQTKETWFDCFLKSNSKFENASYKSLRNHYINQIELFSYLISSLNASNWVLAWSFLF